MDENQIRGIVQEAMQEHSSILWKELLIVALNSPVVMFIVLAISLWFSRDKLAIFLSSRNMEIGWGNKSIKLSDLSNNVDQEIDPIKEQIEEIKQAVAKLNGQPEQETEEEDKPKLSDDAVRTRARKALSSPKFRWRSIDSIAKFARSSSEEILEILEADDSVIIGRGKNGETLAKFKHR